jgi:uncharacterized membrane protein YfcA
MEALFCFIGISICILTFGSCSLIANYTTTTDQKFWLVFVACWFMALGIFIGNASKHFRKGPR